MFSYHPVNYEVMIIVLILMCDCQAHKLNKEDAMDCSK